MPPATPTKLDRLRDLGLVLLLVLAAGWSYAALRPYIFEDAYITYRYAANLAAGHGFVFQPGEYVLGTSTPLYTLLLGLLGAFGADIPTAGNLIYVIALAACAFFGFLILARRGAPNAGVIFAAWAVSGAFGVFSYFGMETTLHLALIFLAAWLCGEERPVATGIVLGLICLNRYDGVMAVAAVLLTRLLASRRLPWTEALISGGIFGGWLLFAQLYFGSPLPNTYAAKAADVGIADYAIGSLDIQAHLLLKPLYRLEPPLRLWPWLWQLAVALLALPLLLRAGAALLRRFRREARPVEKPPGPPFDLAPLGFCALFLWLGYSYIGPPLEHHWYLIPASFCVLAISLAGWGHLFGFLPAAWRSGGALAFLLLTAAVLPRAVGQEAALMTSVTYGSDRIDAYREMAEWVKRQGFEKTTLLTHEPGYLTYLSGQRAIDAAGLVTANIYYHGPKERRSDRYELLEAKRPELAMLGSPVQHEPLIRENRYLLALSAAPSRNLWISRDFYRQNLDRLYDSWQRGDYYRKKDLGLRHPFAIDFGVTAPPPFFGRNVRIDRLEDLTFEGRPAKDEPVLTSRGNLGPAAAWSQPFPIDFDELDFLFSANHDFLTAAQLFVDGLLAYEIVGQNTGGANVLAPFEKMEVPVYSWRGRQGVLYFVSAEGDRAFMVADRVASKRYARSRSFDDFESGAYDPAIWEKGFGAAPVDNKKLAAIGGLHMVQGRFAATSLFAVGAQEMVSRPFLIENAFLSCTVFDFGDERTRIELRTGGRRQHLYTGRGKNGLDLLKWDLRHLQGQEAVLIVRDDIPADDAGIGIDSILLYDE